MHRGNDHADGPNSGAIIRGTDVLTPPLEADIDTLGFPIGILRNGDIAFVNPPPWLNYVAANGVNDDVVFLGPPIARPIRVAGPTLAYSITSIANPVNGQRCIIWNSVVSALTIVHEAATGTANNRIKTKTAANVVLAQFGIIELIYQGRAAPMRWLEI